MNKIVNIAPNHPFGLSISSEKLGSFLFYEEKEPTIELQEGIWYYETKNFAFIHDAEQADIFHFKNKAVQNMNIDEFINNVISELTV